MAKINVSAMKQYSESTATKDAPENKFLRNMPEAMHGTLTQSFYFLTLVRSANL